MSTVMPAKATRQWNDHRDLSSHYEQDNLQRRDIHDPFQHWMLDEESGIPNGGDDSDHPTKIAIRNLRIVFLLVVGQTSRANDAPDYR